VSAHYISAIGDFLGISLYKETPQLGFDLAGALVDSFLVEQSQYLSELVCLHTSLKMESMKVNGAFLFLPQKASIKKLMDHLTVENLVDRLNNKKKPQSTATKTTVGTPKVVKPVPTPAKMVVETVTPIKPVPAKKAAKKATAEKLDFSPADLDIFSELGNIGAGHASNALSQMINKKVMIDVPIVNLATLDKIRPMFQKIGDTVTGTFSLVTKNVDANIVLMFSVQSIENILQIILDLPKPKKLKTATDVTENEQSAIQELNSILIGHYISALSNFLRVPIDPPKHHFFFEKTDAFFTNLERDSEKDVVSVIIETKMNVVGTEPIIGYFIMIPTAQNLKDILKRIQDIWEK
ncbi:MAG: chemotaxis protein CheY, partial [Promethearchaeota archaeon CR_4]